MLILYLLLIGISANQCPIFTCDLGNVLPNNQCSKFTSPNEYLLRPCTQDLECPGSLGTNSSCVSNQVITERFPGDICSLDLECLSGSCDQGICQGQSLNELCSIFNGCLPGYFCNSGVCVGQIKIGGACKLEIDCVNNATCDMGICVEYWSLENGDITGSVINGGFSFTCMSGFAESVGDKFNCAKAPVSTSLPLICQNNTLCISKDGKFSQPCQCGFTSNGNGYCPLFAGDPPVQNAIAASKAVLASNADCNTFSRFSYNCFANHNIADQKSFLNFSINLLLIKDNYYPIIQQNPRCVQEIYTYQYWNMVNALNVIDQPQCSRFICTNSTYE